MLLQDIRMAWRNLSNLDDLLDVISHPDELQQIYYVIRMTLLSHP